MADVVGAVLIEGDGPKIFNMAVASCCSGFSSNRVKVPTVVLNASGLSFVPSQVGFNPRHLVHLVFLTQTALP